jgi:uncharacterized protein (TIGR03083 family)
MDNAAAYARAHDRIIGLLDESTAEVEVPTCPGWTVKDVVAHLAGFFTAYQTGDPQRAFGPSWGDDAVKERQDRSLQECISEWNEHLANPGDLFDSQLGLVAVSDTLAHEQDIRTALKVPGGEDDDAIVSATGMGLSFLGKKVDGGLPPIRIVTDDIDTQIGEGAPAATLRTSTFELFRTIHGRRTIDQIGAMDWEGDPGRWTSELFIFGPTERKVES